MSHQTDTTHGARPTRSARPVAVPQRAHAAELHAPDAGPAARIAEGLQGRLGNALVQGALTEPAAGLPAVVAWDMAAASAGIGSEATLGEGSNQVLLRRMKAAGEPARQLNELLRPGGGQPLPAPVREAMERAFGRDFSQVRVHVGAEARRAARAAHARAFTLGEHVWFGDEGLSVDSAEGRRLLAHELTHVVQHQQGRVSTDGVGVELSQPGDALEREAEAQEGRVLSHLEAFDDAGLRALDLLAEPGLHEVQADSGQREASPGLPGATLIARDEEDEAAGPRPGLAVNTQTTEDGEHRDPEQHDGVLEYSEDRSRWDAALILSRLTQIDDDPVTVTDMHRCATMSVLSHYVQQGPSAVTIVAARTHARLQQLLGQSGGALSFVTPELRQQIQGVQQAVQAALGRLQEGCATYQDLRRLADGMHLAARPTDGDQRGLDVHEDAADVGGGEASERDANHPQGAGFEALSAFLNSVQGSPGRTWTLRVTTLDAPDAPVSHAVAIGTDPEGRVYLYEPSPREDSQVLYFDQNPELFRPYVQRGDQPMPWSLGVRMGSPLPQGQAAAAAPAAEAAAHGQDGHVCGPSCPAHDVQQRSRSGAPAVRPGEVHQAARRGLDTGAGRLPFLGRLQAAFGRHDLSSVRAHTGAAARASSLDMGAAAYASGEDVVFGTSADLHLAAHEAAHVIQQRAGVSLSGGVGEVGDAWERHADAVADAVVAGSSAEPLLDELGAPSAAAAAPEGVQMNRFTPAELQPHYQEDLAAMPELRDLNARETFLGVPIVGGVCGLLSPMLRNAERLLRARHPGVDDRELATLLGFQLSSSPQNLLGRRGLTHANVIRAGAGAYKFSYHVYGLALDVQKVQNAKIDAGPRDSRGRDSDEAIVARATRLCGPGELRVGQMTYDSSVGGQEEQVRDLHQRFGAASRALEEYLGYRHLVGTGEAELPEQRAALRAHLQRAGEADDEANIQQHARQAQQDHALMMEHNRLFWNPDQGGFFNLSEELVQAFVAADFKWGGAFGNTSDTHHFQHVPDGLDSVRVFRATPGGGEG